MRMRSKSSKLAAALLVAGCLPALAAKPRHHGNARLHKSLRSSPHQAEGISSERATEIQSALIQKGYLTGTPSGTWDAQTSAAMARLQGDNGWQTKITPDARGLIKLGLGPQQTASVTPHE